MDLLQTVAASCPSCGEPIELLVDCSGGDQTYVEDCQVCCAPMQVRVSLAEADGSARVSVEREND
jgi:hypothetical protein